MISKCTITKIDATVNNDNLPVFHKVTPLYGVKTSQNSPIILDSLVGSVPYKDLYYEVEFTLNFTHNTERNILTARGNAASMIVEGIELKVGNDGETYNLNTATKYTLKYTASTGVCDLNGTIKTAKIVSSASALENLKIFADGLSGFETLHKVLIKNAQNDTILVNATPMKIDDVVGLYDSVSNTLLTPNVGELVEVDE